MRSRLWHCRRCVFIRSGHDASIFLCPLAPPELPGFIATMDTLTPVQWLFLPVGSPAGIRHMNTILFRTGLSASRIWPSEHPIPNHSSDPSAAFTHNPSARWASSPGYVETMLETPDEVWASPLPSRLAERISRNGFVFRSTGCSFTSCCSPPRLAATQLHSVTGRSVST